MLGNVIWIPSTHFLNMAYFQRKGNALNCIFISKFPNPDFQYINNYMFQMSSQCYNVYNHIISWIPTNDKEWIEKGYF